MKIIVLLLSFSFLLNCSSSIVQSNKPQNEGDDIVTIKAEIISVKVSGNEMSYTFSVKIESPDKGCKQYADWWEVVSEEGKLIYRRILLHSHANEQPFERSGGVVPIKADQIIIVRGHMNNFGYSNEGVKGSVNTGFKKVILDSNFAIDLEHKEPLPQDCAF